jgi:squalene-associated FAD-dependent desaturase
MVKKRRVVIIGGGLAGLAAAIVLPPEDFEVILVERRPFLGGRASSYPVPRSDSLEKEELTAADEEGYSVNRVPASGFEDSAGGVTLVDNCQHVLMKCCTNLLDFYRRLSVNEAIAFFDRYTFLDEQGRAAILQSSFLPAPLHLLPSFLRFHPLSWKDRLRVAYGLFYMLVEEPGLEALDRITMLDWLCKHHQSPQAIQKFWQTVLVSALNEEVSLASARYGIKVFLDGLLKHREAFHMGVPVVPLKKLYTEPCLKLITRRGGCVKMRCSATGIDVKGSRVSGVFLNNGSRLTGDYYMSCVPPQALLSLLPTEVSESSDYFRRMRYFENSPITAVYLWFDRQVTILKNAALLGREIQWIFNKTADVSKSAPGKGQNLGLVVSASRKLVGMKRDEILDIALRDLQEVLPSSRQAVIRQAVVLKEPFATFSCRAGSDILRPDQQSPLENLFVAGDWTRTGWPPTMEGAVRSGYRCAELIFKQEGKEMVFLQPDLPAQRLPLWIISLSGWLRPNRSFAPNGKG